MKKYNKQFNKNPNMNTKSISIFRRCYHPRRSMYNWYLESGQLPGYADKKFFKNYMNIYYT